jgi:hypothetical protein
MQGDPRGNLVIEHHHIACNDSEQNWYHTLAGFEVSLGLLKKVYPHVTTIHGTSDNASNYHGTPGLIFLPLLFSIAGLYLAEWCFSVAGMGKNIGDTDGSHNTHKIMQAVNNGANATTAKEIVTILSTPPIVKGSVNGILELDKGKLKHLKTALVNKKIPGNALITNCLHWKVGIYVE